MIVLWDVFKTFQRVKQGEFEGEKRIILYASGDTSIHRSKNHPKS